MRQPFEFARAGKYSEARDSILDLLEDQIDSADIALLRFLKAWLAALQKHFSESILEFGRVIDVFGPNPDTN
jgi:hypothetical protein